VALGSEEIFSCLTPVVALQAWSITTVEALATERNPSPLQRAKVSSPYGLWSYLAADTHVVLVLSYAS
jgi:aerobic-type carbon monoxide dehydrogenase small subunit (CoxS/CutS family)